MKTSLNDIDHEIEEIEYMLSVLHPVDDHDLFDWYECLLEILKNTDDRGNEP